MTNFVSRALLLIVKVAEKRPASTPGTVATPSPAPASLAVAKVANR